MPRTYPRAVNISNLSATSILLAWQPLDVFDRNGIIKEYRVIYNTTTLQTDGVVYLNNSVLSLILQNLIPYTTYKIALSAATVVGFGPSNPNITWRTQQSGNYMIHVKVK